MLFQSAMLLQDIFVIDLSKKSCNDNLLNLECGNI